MATTLTAGSTATVSLDAFDSLTLVVTGKATLNFTSQAADLHSDFSVSNAQSKTYGPYGAPMSVLVTAVDQSMTYQKGSASPGRSFTTANAEILQIGTTTQGSGKEIVNITRLDTNADAVIRPSNVYVEQATNLGTTMTCDFHNIDALCYGGGSNTRYTANVGLYCIEGQAQFTGTASQTLGKAVGIYGLAKSSSTNGTLSVSAGVQGTFQNTGAGTTTLGAAFYAKSPTISAGTVTEGYGLYVEAITGATTNYAIKTNAGLVSFGDDVQFTTRTPASAAAAGTAGTITWDSGFLYVATAANTWKRVAIATW